MAKYKAVVDFNSMPDGALLNQAKTTRGLLVINAATFPNLPVTMAAFLTKIGDFETSMQVAKMGGTDRTTTKNARRADVLGDLNQIATNVNQVANGDPTIIDLSGLPRYSTEHGPAGDVTFVPQERPDRARQRLRHDSCALGGRRHQVDVRSANLHRGSNDRIQLELQRLMDWRQGGPGRVHTGRDGMGPSAQARRGG
jgi:hypothetical protein